MNTTIVFGISKNMETGTHSEYIVGAIIALLILGYLIYTLVKPENF
jgi:K+-transporting ATPase KdpF subunit